MTDIHFVKSDQIRAKSLLEQHLQSMLYPLDSYMELKFKSCQITEVMIRKKAKGYIGTIDDTIWFYFMLPEIYYLGSQVLEQFIKQTKISKTTVLTCDVSYNGILSDFSLNLVSKEGRYYSDNGDCQEPQTTVLSADFRLAQLEDIEKLKATTKGYYADFTEAVLSERVYLLEMEEEILGCGTLNPSNLFNNWISLGVNVIECHRRKGVGTKLIWHLKQEAYRKGLSIMAGSWYFNTIIGKCLVKNNMLPIAKEVCYQIGERDKLPNKSGTLVIAEKN